MLVDVLGLKVSVREKACLDRFEASVGYGQEDASNVDHISRVDLTAKLTVALNCELTRDVTDWDLVGHLLDLDLLEGQEPRSAS